MPGAKGHHAIDIGLQSFRHESLQHMAFNRQLQARHGRHLRGIARRRKAEFLAADKSPVGLNPHDLALHRLDAGDFAVLDNVDAA